MGFFLCHLHSVGVYVYIHSVLCPMVPFLVTGMPKQAVVSDNVNVWCFGTCGFHKLNPAPGPDSAVHAPHKDDKMDTVVQEMMQEMECGSDDAEIGSKDAEASSSKDPMEVDNDKDPVGGTGSKDSWEVGRQHRVWTFARPQA